MKITFAGTSSGMAVASRAPSALFIEIDQDAFLIDAGDGTARQLVKFNLDYSRIRAIIITHMHADHAAGLIGLIQLMHLSGREEPIVVFVPDSIQHKISELLPLHQMFQEKWSFRVLFRGILDMQKETISSLSFETVRNSHLDKNEFYAQNHDVSTDSYSLLLGQNNLNKCVYTSDIWDYSHLQDKTNNIDTLITECTHVPFEEGIRFAEMNSISRIIFTHISPDVDENLDVIRNQYPDPSIQFASDGDIIEIL